MDNNGDPIVGHTLAVYGSTYCISCLDKTDSCYISLNKLVDSLETDNNGFIEISLGGENSDFVTSSQCPSFKIVDSNGNTNKNHYIMLDENNYGYLEIVYNPYEGQEIGTTTFDIGFSCSGSALIPNGSQANSVLIRIRVGDSGSFIPDLNGAHPINNTSFVISDGVVQGDNLLKVQIKEPDSSIWHACHPDENISIDLGSSNVTENNSQYYFNRSNIYEDETINLVLIYDSICEIDDSIN